MWCDGRYDTNRSGDSEFADDSTLDSLRSDEFVDSVLRSGVSHNKGDNRGGDVNSFLRRFRA